MSNPLSNGGSFAEAHKDFVLKLKFVGDGDGSQIRRVRLPRIVNGQGEVSYEELVGLAVSFVIPENPRSASDFVVKLTYQDVDDDTVVVGSSEELIDAIDQFSGQHVLRMTAEVKPCVRASSPQQPSSRAPAPSQRPTSDAEGHSNSSPGTAKRSTQPTPVLQHVVESVVNIILNAAVSINGRQGDPPAASSTPVYYTPEGVIAETGTTTPTVSNTQDAGVAEAPKSEPKGLVAVEDKLKKAPCAAKPQAAPNAKPKAEEKPEEEHPFIHGRHTCDGCLTTPIIGKRYHASNMSDYDLCENCFLNYKGSEIQYEPAELERDRHLQKRWLRRKFNMNKNRRGPCGPRFQPPRMQGGRPRPPQHGPPHRGPRGQRLPPFPKVPQFPPGAMAVPPFPRAIPSNDLAMEEAIRRSLQESENAPASTPAAPVQVTAAPSASDKRAEASVTSVGKTESVASGDEKIAAVASLKSAPEPSAPLEDEVRSLSSIGSGNTSTSEKASSIKELVANHIEVETVGLKDEEDAVTQPGCVEVKSPSGASFASGVSNIKADEPEECPPKETSFSSAAAGNGDVADMLGETLDKCAQAIDAMVLELDRTQSSGSAGSSECSSYVGVVGTTHEDSVEEEPAGADETEGATILESTEEANAGEVASAVAEGSEGDWQVVTENNQINDDEQLARAAQMIGSALFNSDMRSSGEMMSTLTGSAASDAVSGPYAISYASSVPTSVHSVASESHVSPSQFDRWGPQLDQLHSLGIDDDERCVEILERLSAANIGCGNDDEVSVQQVVNELWKN